MKKKIPKFANAAEEAKFWETHSITSHLDELEPISEPVITIAAKRARRPITIRFDEDLLNALKKIAAKRRIPYQTLIKSWLFERVSTEYPRFI